MRLTLIVFRVPQPCRPGRPSPSLASVSRWHGQIRKNQPLLPMKNETVIVTAYSWPLTFRGADTWGWPAPSLSLVGGTSPSGLSLTPKYTNHRLDFSVFSAGAGTSTRSRVVVWQVGRPHLENLPNRCVAAT